MKKPIAKKLYRTLAILLSVLVVLFAIVLSLQIADIATEKVAHITPSYAKINLAPYCENPQEWTKEDYAVLYRQTGLSKTALDEIRDDASEVSLADRLQRFQEALFYEGEIEHEIVAVTSKRDMMKGFIAPVAPVHPGDILVSASTHSWGWRNGHAALVLNSHGTVLESLALGMPSAESGRGLEWFGECSNFMLLRMKDADESVLNELVKNARIALRNVPYSLTVGIFGKKDRGIKPDKTQCAHLVWQAYKNAGFDIDANGGGLVTPRDVARCPLFEVVQVYGFDLDKLW